MQALILAGGLGTRLRAVIDDKPKPMANIAGKPFLEYQIELLKRHDIAKVTLCVGYLHGQIQAYFGDGGKWGAQINYSIEKELLGTAGALKLAERYITGPFLVFNGDSYLEIDLRALIQFHRQNKAASNCVGTMALTERQEARDYGSVILGAENEISQFQEKSEQAAAGAKLINAGIYVLEPEILRFIPAAQKVSLERETFPAVLQQGHPLFGYCTAGYFVDIGTPAGYGEFQKFMAATSV